MVIVFHCKHSRTLHESNMPPYSTGRFEPVIRLVHSRVPLDRQLDSCSIRPAHPHLQKHRSEGPPCQTVVSVFVVKLAIG